MTASVNIWDLTIEVLAEWHFRVQMQVDASDEQYFDGFATHNGSLG